MPTRPHWFNFSSAKWIAPTPKNVLIVYGGKETELWPSYGRSDRNPGCFFDCGWNIVTHTHTHDTWQNGSRWPHFWLLFFEDAAARFSMNAFVVSSSKTLPASKQKHIRPLHVETRSAASNWELKNMVKKLAHVTVLFFCFSYFILFFPIFFFLKKVYPRPPPRWCFSASWWTLTI